MIPLDRGDAPPILAEIRARELDRVRAALAGGEALSSGLIGRAYEGPDGCVRTTLRTRQHYKCCWCGHRSVERNRDVEHYRPKASARGADGIARPGYWWLAWSWSNLFFSCDGCNRYEKGDDFPLMSEDRRLEAEQQPPGRERPLLLEPADQRAHPIDHIRFMPDRQVEHRWRPVPRGGSRRGAVTIRLLGLDRDELLDLYAAHARDLTPAIDEVRRLARDHADGFAKRWHRLCASHLRPYSAFPALTHDLLDHAVPATLRRHLGVELPRPPYTP